MVITHYDRGSCFHPWFVVHNLEELMSAKDQHMCWESQIYYSSYVCSIPLHLLHIMGWLLGCRSWTKVRKQKLWVKSELTSISPGSFQPHQAFSSRLPSFLELFPIFLWAFTIDYSPFSSILNDSLNDLTLRVRSSMESLVVGPLSFPFAD